MPERRIPQVPPVPASPPLPSPPQAMPSPWLGCQDPLEDLLRMPAPGELIGRWRSPSESLTFSEAGDFQWAAADLSLIHI